MVQLRPGRYPSGARRIIAIGMKATAPAGGRSHRSVGYRSFSQMLRMPQFDLWHLLSNQTLNEGPLVTKPLGVVGTLAPRRRPLRLARP